MTRKSKRVMARILAVVMAVTLVPSNMWGTANVVRAEETSEVFTEEDADVSAEDVSTKIVQEPQEEADEKEKAAVVEETEDVAPVDVEETVEDDKDAGVKAEKKETEKVSAETDNKLEDGVHVHNFTGADGSYNGTSDGYFTLSSSEKGSQPELNYNGVSLKKAMKVASSSGVTFTAPSGSTLILVYTLAEDKGGIKVDGVTISATKNADVGAYVLELTLDKEGEHTVLRDQKEAFLYYISVTEPAGSKKETVDDPTADPASGEVAVDSKIKLSCATEGATLHYTTDGSDPKDSANENVNTHTGETEITITNSMVIDNKVTIRAYATKDGCTESETVGFEYTVAKAANQLAEPTATPNEGEVARGTKVTLASNETGASIYYTTDGTEPSIGSTLFEEDKPIIINEETTIKAIAVKQGYTTSFPASFTYTIKKPTLNSDTTAEGIISSIEPDDAVTFTNQDGKEVFNIKLKAEELATPEAAVKIEAEKLKIDGGRILYYDFTLVNADNENDTVKLTGGTVTIKMPYSIVTSAASKLNDILVLHNTDQVEVTKETDGFSFIANSFSPYTVIINPASQTKEDIIITKSAGYEEGAYAEWEAVEGADGYMAYVAPAGGEYKRIDDELIREYKDHWRVDTVGLAKGTYYIKINAVVLGEENNQTTATVIGTGETRGLKVVSHDRSGYAWVNGTSSGAYNEDGTLKSNANVIYVTEETKDTVSLDVVTNKNGTTTPCEGIQNILDAYKKGLDTRALDIRIIGNVTNASHLLEDDIVIENAQKNNIGITVEGIGEDAVANGWGIRVKNASNVEIRNLGFMNRSSVGEKDNLGLQQDNDHVWVHHCDMFYGNAGKDKDQVKGDGALDCKKSDYVTFSYNHFWDSGKCCLLGLSEGTNDLHITYHHNWFDHSDSRHPRVRYFTTHVYNNYYDGNAKYGVGGALGGASIFVENNYFRNCPYPMLISMQGSDVWDGSKNNYGANATFSKEDGSIIKAYGNVMEGETRFIPYSATDNPSTPYDESVDFDAYVASSRNEKIPNTVKTVSSEKITAAGAEFKKGSKGSNIYNNFDTQPDFYDYTPDDARDVPAIVMAGAGRLNGGDFKWSFENSVEDSNHDVIDELKTAVLNYKGSVKIIGGNVEADVKVLQNDSNKAPDDDITKDIKAPTASKPTNTEVSEGDTITLSCDTEGAEIYYTVNGSKPTKNSIHYTGNPISITGKGTTTIMAIAYVGEDYSTVSVFRYIIPGDSSEDPPESSEPESEVGPKPSEPESEPGPKPSEPESESVPKPSEPESEPGSKPSEPESEPGSKPSEPESEPITAYKIHYDANGGTAPSGLKDVEKQVGDTVDIPADCIPKAGYEFKGWSIDKINVLTGAYTVKAEDAVNGIITITALYDAKTYTISYDPNGGTLPSEVSETVTAKAGDRIMLPNCTSEDGKPFIGWQLGSSGNIITISYVVNAANADDTNTIVMKAVYGEEGKTYFTVTIDTDGGTLIGGDENRVVVAETRIDDLGKCEKEGFKFEGWTVDGADVTMPYVVTKDVTFKAKYTKSSSSDKEGIYIEGIKASYVYTGDKITPAFNVVNYDISGGTVLTLGVDYTVTYKNNKEPGENTATVIVKGKGNYASVKGNEVSKTFSIVKLENIPGNAIEEAKLISVKGAKITTDKSVSYDGTPKYPDIKLELKGADAQTFTYKYDAQKEKYVRDDNGDMNVYISVSNNVDKGNATILVTGAEEKGKATSVKAKFKITAVKLDNTNTAITEPNNETGISAVYSPQGAVPKSLEVTYTYKDGEGKDVSRKLTYGKDYIVKYSGNNKVGNGTVTVTGKGGYAGKASATFAIDKAPMTDFKVASAAAHDGLKTVGNIKATVVHRNDGSELKAKQYQLKYYKNDKDAEEYDPSEPLKDSEIKVLWISAVAVDTDNLKEDANTETERTKVTVGTDISKANFKFVKTFSMLYTGNQVTLTNEAIDKGDVFESVTIKVKGEANPKNLVRGTDYEIVSYSNNINKGNATAVIAGKGDYSGTKTIKFKIGQQPIKGDTTKFNVNTFFNKMNSLLDGVFN